MRIAYLAPYKGPTLVERRPVVRNLSLSNTIKIELITKLLRAASHDVEIISMGEVTERRTRLYPGFKEPKAFHPEIPIYYASSLPIRFVNGFWSSFHMLRQFKARHREAPFDLMIIFNFRAGHVACANYAAQCGVPVILEYEDDAFVDVGGRAEVGLMDRYHLKSYSQLLKKFSGGIGVSPYLLDQLPNGIPKLLLRGVVGDDVKAAGDELKGKKKNWVVFSGTHQPANGVRELIQAWGTMDVPGWELHITGHGQLTEQLKQLAEGKPGIVFHGLVSREKLLELLCSARICINPHLLSETPGNVFAFKLIEYLAAGAHCITTPMGTLDAALEAGITYMANNAPETIASTLKAVINGQEEREARQAALSRFGSEAVMQSLDALVTEVKGSSAGQARARSLVMSTHSSR